MAEDELPQNPAEATRKVLTDRFGSENVNHDALDEAARVCESPMTPLERAARALFRNLNGPDVDPREEDLRWPAFVDDARAVLAAIREPSEGMRRAIFDEWGEPASAADMDEISERMWQAGIDAALAEGE